MSFAPVSRQEPSTFTGDFIMTHRKSAFELTAAEQNRFLQVITAMNTDNDPTLYAQFVGIHADMRHHMHTGMGGGAVGRQRFLPWHRDFLLKFETAMQQIDPAASKNSSDFCFVRRRSAGTQYPAMPEPVDGKCLLADDTESGPPTEFPRLCKGISMH